MLRIWYSREELNLHFDVRSVVSYPLNDGSILERAMGIEPTSVVWKTTALPLSNARIKLSKNWRPWPESNGLDKVLETSPIPLPHGP